jgi:hypothetical protein
MDFIGTTGMFFCWLLCWIFKVRKRREMSLMSVDCWPIKDGCASENELVRQLVGQPVGRSESSLPTSRDNFYLKCHMTTFQE